MTRPPRAPSSPAVTDGNPNPATSLPQPTEPTDPDNRAVDGDQSADIVGALGRIRVDHDGYSPDRGLKGRLLAFLTIMGPGLIVMIGDNDAGGVATYAQAGQNYGYSLLWTLTLLVPVLIVNQEMVVRLGAVSHVGLAMLITKRFGRFWGWFSAADLFILNFLTLATEFIGVALAFEYLHIDRTASVPIAATALITIAITGSFRRWERAMFVFLLANLLLVPLIWLSHPDYRQIGHHLVVPGVQGGMSSDAVLLIIAIVGTTVAPWQLFFQQSNVIDKRITPRFITYERADTVIGSVITQVGAIVFLAAGAVAVAGTPLAGKFTDALGVADALAMHSQLLGTLFALLLLDASIIGAAAITLSTSYAFGDMFGVHHSLHRRVRDAKAFYVSYTLLVILAAAIVLIPRAPLGLITLAVQALAGILLPAASAFLLLLCNDRHVLGPWINPRWLNIVTALIIGVLLLLSGTLLVSTLFPGANTAVVLLGVAAALVIGSMGALLILRLRRHDAAAPDQPTRPVDRSQRPTWRTPPLATLAPYTWSPTTKLAMVLLQGYLVLAALLLVVKAIQLGQS